VFKFALCDKRNAIDPHRDRGDLAVRVTAFEKAECRRGLLRDDRFSGPSRVTNDFQFTGKCVVCDLFVRAEKLAAFLVVPSRH
jgi:hypothetical protein